MGLHLGFEESEPLLAHIASNGLPPLEIARAKGRFICRAAFCAFVHREVLTTPQLLRKARAGTKRSGLACAVLRVASFDPIRRQWPGVVFGAVFVFMYPRGMPPGHLFQPVVVRCGHRQ